MRFLFNTAFYKIFIATFFLVQTAVCSAQKLDSTLATYSDKYAQERMYIHYDKSAYNSGETIWFKAYLMQDIFPATESKTLYVDWVDDGGAVLQHLVLPVVEGTAIGQFDVPDTYAGSLVHVRSYTRWMLNFDTAFLYSKNIPILGKNKSTAKTKAVTSLQFFAEGGDAVAGILSKMAFKATDQMGRPQKVWGTIQDNHGAFVDSFHSVHDGMGYFLLIPKEGATYTAKWRDESGGSFSTALPAAKPSGASLQLFISGSKRPFTISRSENVAPTLKQLHLVGTMHEQVVFKANVSLASVAAVRGNIPTDQLPSGVLTITLFDDQWNAIAERITFVNNEEFQYKPQLLVQEWGMKKRARNEIQLNFPDSIAANLSVSITDGSIDRDTSENIFTRLLLTSEIKGIVHKPSYYFSNNSDSLKQKLDLVMLTNGWRRFKWEDVVQGKMPTINYPKDTAYLSLSGRLYGYKRGTADNGGSIILLVKQKDTAGQMLLEPINADGTFRDPDFIFFDTLHVYYQVQKAKGLERAEVSFMNDRLPALNYARDKSFLVNRPMPDTAGAYRHLSLSEEEARLDDLLKVKTLQNVTITAKVKAPIQVMDEKYSSGVFSGGDAYQFDLVHDPSSIARGNIFEYLQGKVAGLQIMSNGSSVTLSWRGGTPQVFLDEMPVDISMLTNVPVSDIAYVKVMRPPFIGAIGGGSSGAISVYTRKGGDEEVKPGKGLSNNTIAGYTPLREFYSPNYNTFDARNDQADLRTTLYWNPKLLVSPKKSSVTFSFFNNDVSKKFRVVVEGMTRDGRLTHYEEVLE